MVKSFLNSLSTQPDSIMSIDASTNSLAFAIYKNKDLIRFGKIEFDGNSTYEKVVDASRKVSSFIRLYEVDAIVIEHTVFMNSPKTAADLALVQGAILGSSNAKIIRSVAPITWQNFIGNKKFTSEEKSLLKMQNPGKSDSWYKNQERVIRKQKTIHYISVQYDKIVNDNDVADAIAIGHYAINNWDRLTKQTMSAKLYTNELWLKKRYHLDKKTPEQIAKECGVSVETIYVYLAKFGLRRSRR